MKRALESKVETRCVTYAKNHGWLVRKMNGLGYRSWPDRLFVGRNSFYVEFKRENQDLTKGQQSIHKKLKARGQSVYVVRAYDEFLAIFATHHSIVRKKS